MMISIIAKISLIARTSSVVLVYCVENREVMLGMGKSFGVDGLARDVDSLTSDANSFLWNANISPPHAISLVQDADTSP